MAFLGAGQYPRLLHAPSIMLLGEQTAKEQALAPKSTISEEVPSRNTSAQISLICLSRVATPNFKGAGKHNTPMNSEGEENQKNGQATLCH